MAAVLKFLESQKPKIYYLIFIGLYVLVVWYATKTMNYFLFGLPLIPIFAYYAMADYKWLWYVMVALMPVSITDPEFFGKFAGLTFPTDFLAIILVALLGFKMISERSWQVPMGGHPIPILIGLQLLWMIFSAVPSSMPIVSWKAIAAFTWLVGAFYIMPLILFKESRTIFRFFQLIVVFFGFAFGAILLMYVGSGRSLFGLRFNPTPFFVDHTVFGAFSAMWVPILVLLSFAGEFTSRERWLSRLGLLTFAAALFFSYSRGAWASCVAALGMLGVVLLGKWGRRLLLPMALAGLFIGTFIWYANQDSSPTRNKAVSRKNLKEHIASVTNFKTDDSNRERINRWYCAWQMFLERPAFGFGPGTYSFKYGDFQKSTSRTEVSTNRGDNGTAHNEWLLAISEQGLPGPILLTLLFIVPFLYALRGYSQASNRNTRLLYLACAFGLLTYDIHAFVNNFMDQDKVGGTYYALLAIITALDLFYLPKEKGLPQQSIKPVTVKA